MVTIILTMLISTYPWPIRPFGSAHPVSATLGDARGNVADPRFHWGIDIPADSGTKVYSISSDTAYPVNAGVNSYVRVGNYWYIHITPCVDSGTYVLGILDTVNTPPDTIGKVLDYPPYGSTQGDHLHFQIGPVGGPFYNPLSYDGGPVDYDDTLKPIISTITFWRRGSEGPTPQPLVGVLDGKVDIRARCQDRQTSGGAINTSGIYKCQYIITDTVGNVVYNSDTTIRFPQVQPPNNGAPVLLVYDRHNYTAVSPFNYWVTNRIVNNQVIDWYWNTKQKIGEPDSVDAESLEVAKFKDGKYWVKVIAADIRNNADTDFEIPNTKPPRIRQVAWRMAAQILNSD